MHRCSRPRPAGGDARPVKTCFAVGHGLSVWECSLLDVLSRRHDGEGGRLQMKQVADAVVTDVSDAGLRHLVEGPHQ